MKKVIERIHSFLTAFWMGVFRNEVVADASALVTIYLVFVEAPIDVANWLLQKFQMGSRVDVVVVLLSAVGIWFLKQGLIKSAQTGIEVADYEMRYKRKLSFIEKAGMNIPGYVMSVVGGFFCIIGFQVILMMARLDDL